MKIAVGFFSPFLIRLDHCVVFFGYGGIFNRFRQCCLSWSISAKIQLAIRYGILLIALIFRLLKLVVNSLICFPFYLPLTLLSGDRTSILIEYKSAFNQAFSFVFAGLKSHPGSFIRDLKNAFKIHAASFAFASIHWLQIKEKPKI